MIRSDIFPIPLLAIASVSDPDIPFDNDIGSISDDGIDSASDDDGINSISDDDGIDSISDDDDINSISDDDGDGERAGDLCRKKAEQ